VSTPRILAALLLGTSLSAQARVGITRADWGITAKGEKVEIFTLTGTGGLEARINGHRLVPGAWRRDLVANGSRILQSGITCVPNFNGCRVRKAHAGFTSPSTHATRVLAHRVTRRIESGRPE